MATCLQGALLVGGDDPEVADVFCASRLGGDWGQTFGTLASGPELATLTHRTTPVPR
jgi:putative acyl-CoA dehydrogenase